MSDRGSFTFAPSRGASSWITLAGELPRLVIALGAFLSPYPLVAMDRAAAEVAEFRAILQPFLKQHCFKCHGERAQESDLALHTLRYDLASEIRYVVQQDRDVLKTLLTTNKAFVNFRLDRKKGMPVAAVNRYKQPRPQHNKMTGKTEQPPRVLQIHEFYNLAEDWQWTKEQPIVLPADQRAGILMQPPVLDVEATAKNIDETIPGRGLPRSSRKLNGDSR